MSTPTVMYPCCHGYFWFYSQNLSLTRVKGSAKICGRPPPNSFLNSLRIAKIFPFHDTIGSGVAAVDGVILASLGWWMRLVWEK